MADAASIISQVAAALHYVHQQGVIHRDVKPGNVLVTPEGVAKLSDLGLSGPIKGGAETDPRFGRIVGTADYVSPDHVGSPWNPTPAWDVYSLGCTLYYAVTGKVPFPGGTVADKVRAHLELRPLDPRRLNPRLSGAFVELMADMMAKNPADRLQSAAEVVEKMTPWTAASVDDAGDAIVLAESGLAVPAGFDRPPADGSRAAPLVFNDLDELDATCPDLSELPIPRSGRFSQLSQPTHPVASAQEETWPGLEVAQGPMGPRGDLLGPLAVFLGFPTLVVGAILLAWWIARL